MLLRRQKAKSPAAGSLFVEPDRQAQHEIVSLEGLEGLVEVVAAAQTRGFVGPGEPSAHVRHARHFGALIGDLRGPFVDLGSGGGLPGLVLAVLWPDAEAVLVDSSRRRCAFLREAIEVLGLDRQVSVWHGRAEEIGRDPGVRESQSLVVSRAFGAPAVLAECASPLIRVGGILAVSEPVDAPEDRWPAEPLGQLSLETAGFLGDGVASVARFRKIAPISARWPRRNGVPTKRPLWV